MAILVNGKSGPAKSEPSPADGDLEGTCAPELIRVDPGKTYRFRTVSAAALSALAYGIEDHDNLTIIAADGHYTSAASISYIQIGSGQRFDYLLHAKTADELETLGKTNFWIQTEVRDRPVNYTSYACLSYDGAGCGSIPPQSTPILTVPHSNDWLEYTLQPLHPDPLFPSISEVTRRIYMYTEQVNISGQLVWHLNGALLDADNARPTPYLVDIYKYGQAAIPDAGIAANNNSYVAAYNAYAATLGDVLDIIWVQRPNIPAGGFDSHPLHIHGAHAYDLGAGPGEYDPVTNEARFDAFTPVLRDTTLLHRYTTSPDTPDGVDQGWRAWRLRVTDPGVWMLHCHTLQHMIMGMQTVWVLGDANDIVRDGGDEVLLRGYLEWGGSAYGVEGGKEPLVNHHWDDYDFYGGKKRLDGSIT
jgi:L-ascorbate oxidase